MKHPGLQRITASDTSKRPGGPTGPNTVLLSIPLYSMNRWSQAEERNTPQNQQAVSVLWWMWCIINTSPKDPYWRSAMLWRTMFFFPLSTTTLLFETWEWCQQCGKSCCQESRHPSCEGWPSPHQEYKRALYLLQRQPDQESFSGYQLSLPSDHLLYSQDINKNRTGRSVKLTHGTMRLH